MFCDMKHLVTEVRAVQDSSGFAALKSKGMRRPYVADELCTSRKPITILLLFNWCLQPPTGYSIWGVVIILMSTCTLLLFAAELTCKTNA